MQRLQGIVSEIPARPVVVPVEEPVFAPVKVSIADPFMDMSHAIYMPPVKAVKKDLFGRLLDFISLAVKEVE